jgi:hypothetical protein
MKKYVFRWNRFFGFSLFVGPILWGQYMILGAIEQMGVASHWFTSVPDSGPLMLMFLIMGLFGCVLASIDEVEM